MRVAIIGGGPRGLWAAERLLDLASGRGAHLDVDVWDDRPLGEGSAYRRDQPDAWRLNVTSRNVTAGIGSFDDWRRAHGVFAARRAEQAEGWFLAEVRAGLLARLAEEPAAAEMLATLG